MASKIFATADAFDFQQQFPISFCCLALPLQQKPRLSSDKKRNVLIRSQRVFASKLSMSL